LFVQRVHREEAYLTIGKVAAIAGASPKAIRHYEKLGLMPPPKRRGKYRIYSERDVFLAHVLKHSQSFGFRLEEMRELVAAKVAANDFPLKLANALFDRKRSELRARMREIEGLLAQLEAMRRQMNRYFRA
jgi:DNA-binding transcriptional MerR regulator